MTNDGAKYLWNAFGAQVLPPGKLVAFINTFNELDLPANLEGKDDVEMAASFLEMWARSLRGEEVEQVEPAVLKEFTHENSRYVFGVDISDKDDVCVVVVGKIKEDQTIEIAAMFNGDTTKESLESANKFIEDILANANGADIS